MMQHESTMMIAPTLRYYIGESGVWAQVQYGFGNMKEETKIFDLAKKIQSHINFESGIFKGPVTPGSPKRRIPEMAKTLKLFKNFDFINLDEGLQKTLDWYKNNEK